MHFRRGIALEHGKAVRAGLTRSRSACGTSAADVGTSAHLSHAGDRPCRSACKYLYYLSPAPDTMTLCPLNQWPEERISHTDEFPLSARSVHGRPTQLRGG